MRLVGERSSMRSRSSGSRCAAASVIHRLRALRSPWAQMASAPTSQGPKSSGAPRRPAHAASLGRRRSPPPRGGRWPGGRRSRRWPRPSGSRGAPPRPTRSRRRGRLRVGMRWDWTGVPWEKWGRMLEPTNGFAGGFGISGTNFNALWSPGANTGSLTQLQTVGKNSANPNTTLYNNYYKGFEPQVG